MAYKPHLRMRVAVPALGDPAPVFHFRPDDEAQVAFLAAAVSAGIKPESTTLAPEVILPLLRLVSATVCGWEGVLGADDEPMPFSPEALAMLPTEDRIQIGTAFLAREGELDARAGLSAGQPTNSTDPAPTTEP